ncbi:MAG: hypothetical protein CM15mP103_12810 [Gammaproteobacteria bacterium]|nr:MAG: hypothetical protein CM15mP103_12810 [Gammaproteobacteria bacterium]
MPGACYTNDAALAPSFVAALECLAHHIDVTNTLKAVVDTAAGHLNQVIYDVLDLFRVNKIGHAELRSQFLLLNHANNTTCTDQLGALNNIQANTTQTEYRDGGAGLDFIVNATARCRWSPAANVADLVEGRVLSHFATAIRAARCN